MGPPIGTRAIYYRTLVNYLDENCQHARGSAQPGWHSAAGWLPDGIKSKVGSAGQPQAAHVLGMPQGVRHIDQPDGLGLSGKDQEGPVWRPVWKQGVGEITHALQGRVAPHGDVEQVDIETVALGRMTEA